MDALPQEVRQEVVMRAAQMDGHSLTTYRFNGTESADALRASVARHFRDAGRQVIELTRGEWNIVSARSPKGFETVQVRATARGSEGMATEWRWSEPRSGAAPHSGDDGANSGERTAFTSSRAAMLVDWLPAHARVVRQIRHHDPGREGATLIAMADVSPEASAQHLRARAIQAGFVLDPSLGMPAQGAAWYRGGPNTGSESSGEALALRRNAEEVIATVSRHRGATALVLHWSRPL